MNKAEVSQLKVKFEDFDNADVYIQLDSAIQFHCIIRQAKVIVSDDKLIISNGQENDIIFELFYLEKIKIEGNNIFMEMSNDLEITLSY